MHAPTTFDPPPSVLHTGELAVQSRVGVREAVADMARQLLRPYLSEQLRAFFPRLPFVVAAARDARARPWATLLCGEPGFVATPDTTTLTIAARPAPGDALEHAFVAGAHVGLLGIELETRRRNRVNGTVTASDTGGIGLSVDQAFGNCPQYISTREREVVALATDGVRVERGIRLDGRARALIVAADTLFVASGHAGDGPAAGMDASHRGGAAGFVDIVDERRLSLPDYAGNRLFNTLGNLEIDPRIGLLFVDFGRGGLLQLTGRARIEWSPAPSARHSGAQRLVHVAIDEWVRLERALPWRWRGTADTRRELVVVTRTRESEDVVSLALAPRDGRPLPFEPGQYLPLELPHGDAREHVRTYSLSGDPALPYVRIGVRRDPRGSVSRALHGLRVGDVVLAGPAAGDFALPPGDAPVALIGAGIGMTPLLAMAHALAGAGREGFVLCVARDGAHAPFATELRALCDAHPTLSLHTAFTRPREEDRKGIDYDVAGRPDAALLTKWFPEPDREVRLCGPPGFVADMSTLLIGIGTPAERIAFESF